MARSFLKSVILTPLAIASFSKMAWAVDAPLPITQKHLLPHAVQLQITQRGMKYFDSRLSEILGNLGIKLDEGYFPAMSYTFDKDINPDDFTSANPETVKMYKQVRDLLTQWLVGFSMNNHRPVIEIGESGYMAEFSRFGLVTDENLMNKLGHREGAVLAIELEVKRFTIASNAVVAWDLNNEFLGKTGMEEVTIEGGQEQVPLKIRLPFFVRMNAYGGLDFEALEIENTIDQTPLEIQYKKLIVPTFAVEVNGKKFYLNNQEVDKFFKAQAPFILQKVRENLGEFAKKQLPQMLNQKAKESLKGSLEQIQDMAPPGQEEQDRRPPFKWGLRLENIDLKKSLNINLTAYIEDPLNGQSTPLLKNSSRGLPGWNLIPQENFDLALSVDRSLVNRVLQLSFERKNFEKISQSDGSVLKLRAPPLIDYVKAPVGVALKNQEAFVKLRVSVENQPGSMFLKNTIVIDFDIIAKLRQLSDKSGMQLVLYTIDPDSLLLDDKYISWAGSLFKGKVRQGVKDKLKEMSAGWKAKEEVIPGALPLPPEVLGIKLDINRVTMDPNGHLVMYLDYAKKGEGL